MREKVSGDEEGGLSDGSRGENVEEGKVFESWDGRNGRSWMMDRTLESQPLH